MKGTQMASRYQEIRSDIRAKIRAGKWAPGAQLPRLREFADEYDCTGTMVRHALGGLIDEGWVITTQGAGSWVADPLPQAASSADPFEAAAAAVTASLAAVAEATRELRAADSALASLRAST